MAGEQTRKPKPQEEQAVQADETKTSQESSADVDDLLDEIDEVLEQNAEEFVRSYVQKGGE